MKSYEIAELFLKGKKEMTLSLKQFNWLVNVINQETKEHYHPKSISFNCHNPNTNVVYNVTRVTKILTASESKELHKKRLNWYNQKSELEILMEELEKPL